MGGRSQVTLGGGPTIPQLVIMPVYVNDFGTQVTSLMDKYMYGGCRGY